MSRQTKRQTVVLSERDIPAGHVTSAHWKGKRTPKDTDAQKLIQNSVYKGKMDYYVVYPDGRQVRNPDYWVSQSEGDAAVAAAVDPSQAPAPPVPAAPAPAPAPAPVVNNRLLASLESIAGSLEIIAEVAMAHSPPPPPTVIRQPSMNGDGPSPF